MTKQSKEDTKWEPEWKEDGAPDAQLRVPHEPPDLMLMTLLRGSLGHPACDSKCVLRALQIVYAQI